MLSLKGGHWLCPVFPPPPITTCCNFCELGTGKFTNEHIFGTVYKCTFFGTVLCANVLIFGAV